MYGQENPQDILKAIIPSIQSDPTIFIDQIVWSIFNHKNEIQFETTVNFTNGFSKEVVVHWVVTPGHEDDYALVIVSHLDVTEQRQLELALRQTQKMEAFGQLASGIAHDFNNLMTGIQGYSDLLSRHIPENSNGFRHINKIDRIIERATQLTKQLLMVARKKCHQYVCN